VRCRLPGWATPRFVSLVSDGYLLPFEPNSTLLRASIDNIRLWNVAEVGEFDRKVKSGVQFKIIAGHHGGFISQMRACNFGSPFDLFSYLGSQSLTQGHVSS